MKIVDNMSRSSPSFHIFFYFYILPIHWPGCQKTASSIKSVVSDPINVTSPSRARKVERRQGKRDKERIIGLYLPSDDNDKFPSVNSRSNLENVISRIDRIYFLLDFF